MAENNDKDSALQISQSDLDELFEDLADSGIIPGSDDDLIDQSELDSMFEEADSGSGKTEDTLADEDTLTDEDIVAQEELIEEITKAPVVTTEVSESDMVSQADLDALFEDIDPYDPTGDESAADEKTEPIAEVPAQSAPGSDMVSQDDLDALFDNAAAIEEIEKIKSSETLSKADPDALLDGKPVEEVPAPSESNVETASDEENADFLSQSDLDALLDEAATEEEPESGEVKSETKTKAESAAEEPDLLTQSDLDALLEEAASADEATSSLKEKQSEGTALISQSDLDGLLEESVPEAVEEEPYTGIMTQSDLDTLLAESSEAGESVVEEAGSEMISQDDLDDLFSAPTDEEAPVPEPDKDETSSLVSQADLDALLALEEDDEAIEEDVTPVETAAAADESESPEALAEEPVILEAPDEVADVYGPKEKFSLGNVISLAKFRNLYNKKKLQALYRNRYFKPAAAAILLLMISVPLFFTVKSFFNEKQPVASNTFKIVLPETAYNNLQPVTGDAAIIAMNSFVILPPSARSDVSYMIMDVAVKVTDPKTHQQIKENTTFFRNIIYELLQNTLRAMDKSQINQVTLESAIQKTLNLSLDKEVINNIFIENYDII
ncbi:MAG: hypothetical protein K9L30_04205 [Desulfobacterales bacterium]|nr:hypothetical protein [Desulfobacterales bacterium]